MISVPMRDPREDPELLALVHRYVLPGRRYLKLGGPLLRMEEDEYGRFLRALREDAGAVSAEEIGVLLEGGWRERRTAAWLVAVGGRTEFRERVGDLLLESEVCCAGLAYAVVLAGFGGGRDAELLAAYLERYLRRPDLGYDQAVVWGALLYVDRDRAAALDGLWREWLRTAPHMRHRGGDPGPGYLSLVRRLRAVVEECAEGVGGGVLGPA
ncbi:hypothetical protein G3I57_27245 [Streptomyces albidoflavus]|nr:hypothetical protein [Streptomyces albidoflavus]